MSGGRTALARGWRHFVPALVLLGAAAMLTQVRQQRALALRGPLATLPLALEGHAGTDVRLADADLRVLGVSTYLLRQFQRDDASPFSLYVGYYESQTQGHTIHSPRNCLPGAGWSQLEAGTRRVSVPDGGAVEVNRFLVGNGDDLALVYYWYQGRGRVVADEYRVKWYLLADAVQARRSDEALVRLVVPVAGRDPSMLAHADALAGRVTRHVIPPLSSILPPAEGEGAPVIADSR